jgi:hypothetical protein
VRVAAATVAAALLLAQADPREDLALLASASPSRAFGTLVIWR